MKDEKNNDEVFFNIDSNKEIGNYFAYLDSISKALSKRLDELEMENKSLKDGISKLSEAAVETNNECLEYQQQMGVMSRKFIELSEKYEELLEKYEKEQRRSKLLEIENARNMDDIKNLRKENKALSAKTATKEKETLKDKIHKLIK